MIVTIISKERGLVTIITFVAGPAAGGQARRPHPPVARLAARTRQRRPPWDDQGLTPDDEGAWIPRPLDPRPRPARCAARGAPPSAAGAGGRRQPCGCS